MSKELATRDKLANRSRPDLIKAIARDIGKEVACHIEIQYPEAVKAASSTFLLSVKNCTYNQIMAALEVNGEFEVVTRLIAREKQRRIVRSMYKAIRNKS